MGEIEFPINPRAWLELARRRASTFVQRFVGRLKGEVGTARQDVARAADLQRLLPLVIMALGVLLKRPWVSVALAGGLFLSSSRNRTLVQRLIAGRERGTNAT